MTDCLKCHSFHGPAGQNNLCSQCYVAEEVIQGRIGVTVSNQRLMQLGAELIVQKAIDSSLVALFNDFCQVYKLKFTTVTDNQSNVLATTLSQLASGQLAAHLRGLRDDFPAMIMTAKQACQLLSLCNQRLVAEATAATTTASMEDENAIQHKQYTYVHAICPYIIDPWNIHKHCELTLGNSNWASLVECYYVGVRKTTTPTSYEKLYELWLPLVSGQFFNRDLNYNICECVICYNDISNKEAMIECCQCHKFYHVNCVMTSFKAMSTARCPSCRLDWDGSRKLVDSKLTTDFRVYNINQSGTVPCFLLCSITSVMLRRLTRQLSINHQQQPIMLWLMSCCGYCRYHHS